MYLTLATNLKVLIIVLGNQLSRAKTSIFCSIWEQIHHFIKADVKRESQFWVKNARCWVTVVYSLKAFTDSPYLELDII
jgi:hypothetical protein